MTFDSEYTFTNVDRQGLNTEFRDFSICVSGYLDL